jgi:hypothetical protein
MDHTQWWEPHLHWFWIALGLFMIMMFVCAASWMRRAGAWRQGAGRKNRRMPFGCCARRRETIRQPETPKQILDRRYADGAISREEYGRIKLDIESSPSDNGG